MFFNETPTCEENGNKRKSELSVGNKELINMIKNSYCNHVSLREFAIYFKINKFSIN